MKTLDEALHDYVELPKSNINTRNIEELSDDIHRNKDYMRVRDRCWKYLKKHGLNEATVNTVMSVNFQVGVTVGSDMYRPQDFPLG